MLGVSPTSNEHMPPGLIVAGAYAPALLSEKSLLFGPMIPMLEITSAASPPFFMAANCGGILMELTGCFPKFSGMPGAAKYKLGSCAEASPISTMNASRRRLLATRTNRLKAASRIAGAGEIRGGCLSHDPNAG